MTADDRQRIRLAIDADARRRLRKLNNRYCSGCAAPLECYQPGCLTCLSRRSKRAARKAS